MKKFYSIRFIVSLVTLTAVAQVGLAQDVYWREGFEGGQGFPAAVPFNPTFVESSASGVWYLFLANRTNGTTGACVINAGSADHARFYNYSNYTGVNQNPNLTAADSGYMVTPVVDFGIGELHFKRGRAQRRFTIYKTSDTSAANATWTFVGQSTTANTPSQTCVDTAWTVNDPLARRLKIVARSGTDSDIDSVWMTSTSPIVPVKFTGINAATVNGLTKVTWNIATEINTRSYIVEKSTDGANFKNVAEISATNAGTYSWIDQSANGGSVFYRVKAVDKDGKMGYSGVIKLSTAQTRPGFLITPNVIPGRTMNLQLTNIVKGTVTIRVSNNMGQIVYTSSLINEGGSVSKSISLPGTLQAGTYRVQLVSGSTLMTQTAILQ